MAKHHADRTAPFYDVPARTMVCIEHPAIIKNVDRAIGTLQGSRGITKTLNPPKADAPVNLVLRPEDAMARPLQSISSASNNILLKVTVPKRTGRKRKRGSDEPFTEDPALLPANDELPRPTAKQLLQSLRDNVGRYQVEPVGLVERTHVFRGMPDFAVSTTRSPFINKFREHILPFDYKKMKQFDLDMSKGATTNVDLIPPPSFSHGDIPFNYFYRQNPTVRQTLDTSGNITTINTQQAAKVLTHLVPYDIPVVPSAPRPSCPPIETLDPVLRETISIVLALFQDRPAWTRRGVRNALKTVEQRYALRHAVPYAGYIFRSGPWRDAIVRFGHDPRKDPASRIYQTTMFRLLPREAELARDGAVSGRRHTLPRANEISPEAATSTTSHLFTGKPPLPLDGRMWMFCDITDPLLHSILHPDPEPENFIRSTCDIAVDGWFGNGTLAKLKAIMRSKILALYEGKMPDDSVYEKIMAFPDHASPETGLAGFWLDPGSASVRELAIATEIRSTIKGAQTWKEAAATRERSGEGEAAGLEEQEGRNEESEESGAENGEESEGEEEAMEQAEIAEAVDAAARRGEGGGEGMNDEMEDDDDLQ